MKPCAAGRTCWAAPAVLLIGCATTGRGAFDSVRGERADIDAALAAPATQRAGDDEVLRGPVLERAPFVRAVLLRNRSLESARQSWRAAVARARGAGVLDDPMVTADVAPLSIAAPGVRFGWDVMVSQRLPWPGKLALDEAVAAAEADAARSDVEAAQRELALTASLLFDEYFTAARSIEINAHHVALMQSMRAAAAAAYESGRASAQDPLQAEFELTHMEHDSVILAARRDVTVAQMNELLRRAPELPLPPPPKELPAPPATDAASAERLEAEAVDHRPEIVAAQRRAREAELRGQRAGRESFPDLTVSTGYSTMWDTPEHRWSVGLSFNLPVQTGRRRAAADEASAMRAQYESEAARMGDSARTQVVVGLKRLEESAHVLHLYEERLVPLARDEVAAARAAFTASQAPFVTVVLAEKNLRGVELDEQVARADYDRRRAELDRALGLVPGLDGGEVRP
ncbi:MAG: TolC family protein [Myxococcales bacterium]|nr:TolC family protein [Myxococcales bacterium]